MSTDQWSKRLDTRWDVPEGPDGQGPSAQSDRADGDQRGADGGG